MSTKIYKLFIIHRFTEGFYQLSPEARESLWKKIVENETTAGVKPLIYCNARWCDEAVAGWGVEEYPDIQAVQNVSEMHEKYEWFRYVDSQTFLGTLGMGGEIPQDTLPESIYQLFIIKNLGVDRWESLQQDTRDRIFAGITESIERLGGKLAIACDIDWSNEEYSNYGIIAWPNIEAQRAHFQDIAKIGWHRYIHARTILGTKQQ